MNVPFHLFLCGFAEFQFPIIFELKNGGFSLRLQVQT